MYVNKTLLAATALTWLSATVSLESANAAPFTLTYTLDNPAPASGDMFGYSMDVSDGTAIVGARRDAQGGITQSGSAYLVDTGTGAITHTLINPNPDGNCCDEFGFSVGIDGSRAVVGAWSVDDTTTDQGEVYVYDTSTGALISTLVNPAAAGSASDRFGWNVDISGDKVVVGAREEDSDGAVDSGAAYVFDAITGSLLNTLINPLNSGSDLFGWSVAIDGNLIAVGSRLEDVAASDAGAVHVYDVTTGGLVTSIYDPTPASSDNFGWSVDIDDGRVLVGSYQDDPGSINNAGQAFLFDALTGSLLHTLDNPDPTVGDQFGRAVDLSGGLAAVGAFLDDPGGVGDAGSAYIFDTLTGGLMQSIANPFPAAGDRFGGDIDGGLALDGGTLIVGAYLDDTGASAAGQAYIYNAALQPGGGAVPAPGALVLLGFGLLGIGFRRRLA